MPGESTSASLSQKTPECLALSVSFHVSAAHFRLLNRRTRDIATLSEGVLFKETRYQYVPRR